MHGYKWPINCTRTRNAKIRRRTSVAEAFYSWVRSCVRFTCLSREKCIIPVWSACRFVPARRPAGSRRPSTPMTKLRQMLSRPKSRLRPCTHTVAAVSAPHSPGHQEYAGKQLGMHRKQCDGESAPCPDLDEFLHIEIEASDGVVVGRRIELRARVKM